MAESQDNDKTELPTQRRRDEARAMGQFAYSHELINGLLLFGGAIGLSWIGLALAQGLNNDFHSQFSRLARRTSALTACIRNSRRSSAKDFN